jgi:hypothetical protein
VIKFRDGIMLAARKLSSRKGRISVTVIASGVFFAIVIAASLVRTGVFTSIEEFLSGTMADRFIVAASDGHPFKNSPDDTDPQLVARAKQLFTERIEEKTHEAERLGITYDPLSEQQPWTLGEDGKTEVLDYLQSRDPNSIVFQVYEEYGKRLDSYPDRELLQSIANPYSPIRVYEQTTVGPVTGSSLTVLENRENEPTNTNTERQQAPLLSDQFFLMPQELLSPYLSSNSWRPESNAVPIVLR